MPTKNVTVLRAQEIFWYQLYHGRIIRYVGRISLQERVIFVDFQEMTLFESQNPILDVQKSFFQGRMRLRFWPADYVLWILKACYAYEKCCLESKESFGINYVIIRHVEMISRQERVIFVDFQEMTPRKSDPV